MVIKGVLAGDITWMESGIFLKLPLTDSRSKQQRCWNKLQVRPLCRAVKALEIPKRDVPISSRAQPTVRAGASNWCGKWKKKITCLNVSPPMSVLDLNSLCCHTGTCLWIGVSCGQVATIVWHYFKCCRTCKRCGARYQNYVLLMTWHGHVHSCLILRQV